VTKFLATMTLAAALGVSTRGMAQPNCMYYAQENAGGLTLCPSPGTPALQMTPEQRAYFVKREQAFVDRRVRWGAICGYRDSCKERVDREIPVPEPTPEALRFLGRYGITEEMAR
jgi:hypothetical protein